MQRKLRRQPKKINLFGCRLFMILRVNKMEGRENRVLKDSGKSKHHKMRTAKMLRAGNSEAMESKGPDKKKSARKNRGIKEKCEEAGILNSCLLKTGKLNFGTVDPCSEYVVRKKRGTGSGAEGKVGSGRYFYCEKSRHGNLPCRQVIDVKFYRGGKSALADRRDDILFDFAKLFCGRLVRLLDGREKRFAFRSGQCFINLIGGLSAPAV